MVPIRYPNGYTWQAFGFQWLDFSGFWIGKISLKLLFCEWKRFHRERLQSDTEGEIWTEFEEFLPTEKEKKRY